MPPLLVEAYSTAAEKLALNAFRAGDVNGLIPCKPASAADVKCRDQFVRVPSVCAPFAGRCAIANCVRYAAAFSAQARAAGKFLEGARVVVEAMLQSPKFPVSHWKPGRTGSSADYAIASRLSYLLWDTMPDKALLDAAAKGELRTAEGRERVGAADARQSAGPRRRSDEFFNQWLRFDRVLNAVKESRRFPEFTPELAAAMVEETRRLLEHLVWDNAQFHGVAHGRLQLPELRSGGAVQASPASGRVRTGAFSGRCRAARDCSARHRSWRRPPGPLETSPTARGIFVREQLLCQHVPPPPPNVNTNLPEPTERNR